jgi:YrbI family 3-deoxy-D-manno-octulosonate 8-phosphate phosphatase
VISSKTPKTIREKLRKIKIVLTDVDGVLTDGGMYYTEEGLVMKKFNVKDGMGCLLLSKAGYKTGIISTDIHPINAIRAEKLKMDYVITGTWEKLQAARNIAESENLSLENIAFIGDDVNDLELLKEVGLSIAPADASPTVKSVVNYVSPFNGGNGVYRELTDMLLSIDLNSLE